MESQEAQMAHPRKDTSRPCRYRRKHRRMVRNKGMAPQDLAQEIQVRSACYHHCAVSYHIFYY